MASVRYLVNDVTASVGFYTEALGFTKGDLTLWLAGPASSAEKPMPDGRKPVAGGWNRFVLQVEDLGGLVTKLRAQGVSFRNEIVVGPGGQQILVEDPSGNVIELFQPA